jgi:hypothetical protein
MKKLGPFGILMALVVLLIVLLLSGRAWKAAMPAAAQALKPGSSQVVPDHGDKAAGDAVRSGKLPDLKTMGKRTDDHIEQVKDASKGQD